MIISYTNKFLILFAMVMATTLSYALEATQDAGEGGGEQILRIGYFELAPHIENNDRGELSGPALEYAKLVLSEMNIDKFKLNGYPIQRTFQMLLMDEIDMVLFVAKTPNTMKKEFVLTDTDVVTLQPGLVVQQDNWLTTPVLPQNLINLRMVYWSGGFVPSFLQHDSIELIKVSGEEIYKRGFLMVESHRADAFFHVDSLALSWWMENSTHVEGLKLVQMPIQISAKSMFSVKSAERFKVDYEKALKKVQQGISYRDFFFENLRN